MATLVQERVSQQAGYEEIIASIDLLRRKHAGNHAILDCLVQIRAAVENQADTSTSLANTQGVLREIAASATSRAQALRNLEQEVALLRQRDRNSAYVTWLALATALSALGLAVVQFMR